MNKIIFIEHGDETFSTNPPHCSGCDPQVDPPHCSGCDPQVDAPHCSGCDPLISPSSQENRR